MSVPSPSLEPSQLQYCFISHQGFRGKRPFLLIRTHRCPDSAFYLCFFILTRSYKCTQLHFAVCTPAFCLKSILVVRSGQPCLFSEAVKQLSSSACLYEQIWEQSPDSVFGFLLLSASCCQFSSASSS